MTLLVRDFKPADLSWLVLQRAQRLWLGLHTPELDEDYGRDLLRAGPAWTIATEAGWIVAACGYNEVHPAYGIAWSLLSEGVGRHQLALTRLVRQRIEDAPYNRIEALVRLDFPPALKWACMVGLEWKTIIERAGPQDEDFVLFERVRPREVTHG